MSDIKITKSLKKDELYERAKVLEEQANQSTDERVEALQEKLDGARAAAAKAEALRERVEELEGVNEDLKARMIASGNAPVPIHGVYETKVEGKKAKFKFEDGTVHLRDESGFVIPTEELLAWASDKNYKPDEEILQKYEGLRRLEGHKGARDLMERLVSIGYGRLKRV